MRFITQRKITTSFCVTDDLLEAIDRRCTREKRTRSCVVRELLEAQLKESEYLKKQEAPVVA